MKWDRKFIREIISVCILMLIVISVRAQTQKINLLVFDRQVPNFETIVNQKNEFAKILVLQETGNPIDNITNTLKKIIVDGMCTIDELHIYVVAKPGLLLIGNLTLGPENIEEYKTMFYDWQSLLKHNTVIVIHSDSLTLVPEGGSLVNSIKEFTGSDVKVME